MKIRDFLGLPNFINKYIERKEPGLDILSNDFCKILKEIDYKISKYEYKYNYEFEVGDNYTIKRFMEFFFTKSKLDNKYNCIYEMELDISKSSTNEFFLAELESGAIISLFVKSYKNGILVFENM